MPRSGQQPQQRPGHTLEEMSQLKGKQFFLLLFALHMLNLWGNGHNTLLLSRSLWNSPKHEKHPRMGRGRGTALSRCFPCLFPKMMELVGSATALLPPHTSVRPGWAFTSLLMLCPSRQAAARPNPPRLAPSALPLTWGPRKDTACKRARSGDSFF